MEQTARLKELTAKIIKARDGIRWHRDQRGHYRCWLDDLLVYENLPEYRNPYEKGLGAKTEFIERCAEFWERRQGPKRPSPARRERSLREPDTDLASMSDRQLSRELKRLLEGIREHRATRNRTTWRDDIALYNLLPEKLLANSTLPERASFLRGCKRFYTTRRIPPKLHEW
jgi:hypothetical protein